MPKVLVTGLGVISALGLNPLEFFHNLIDGKHAIKEIENNQGYPYRKKRGAPITQSLSVPLKWKQFGRTTQMSLLAARQAIFDAKLSQSFISEAALSIGTMYGDSFEFEEWYVNNPDKAINTMDSSFLRQYPLYSIANILSEELGTEGIKNTFMTACASGTHAIGAAYRWIRDGRANIVVCGGADAFRPLTHLGLSSFRIIAPEWVKPFDHTRNGTLVGEGAGYIVLESQESAISRGVKAYCTIEGYGHSCDAYDLASPDENGIGMLQSMKRALQEANISVDCLDYINAHGTGTLQNDASEFLAIQKLLSSHTKKVYVNSIKSAIGHTIGAAGSLEAIATILSIKYKKVSPTLRFSTHEKEDPRIIISSQTSYGKIQIAMSNSFGFGGNNTSILFKEV